MEDTPKLRNASVKALTDVQLVEISHPVLIDLLNRNQELRKNLTTVGKQQLLEKLTKQVKSLAALKKELLDLSTE